MTPLNAAYARRPRTVSIWCSRAWGPGGCVVPAIAGPERIRDAQPVLDRLVAAIFELRAHVLDGPDDPADRAELLPIVALGRHRSVAALRLEVRELRGEDLRDPR